MPERLRRTIRGLEKMIEPLRYQFDDLDKQVRRRPMGIDLVATAEIIHKNMARIEQELALMRERIDMELLLSNDSLSDEDLPLAGDTPSSQDDSPYQPRPLREDNLTPTPAQIRAFAATGNPFEIPPGTDNQATRTDDRAGDETLILRPVKLSKPGSGEHQLPPQTPSPHNQLDNFPPIDLSNANTRVDRSGDETLVLERGTPKK